MKIKKILFVFLVALTMRIVYAWFFVDASNLILEDQMMYIQLGGTMAETGDFLQNTSKGYTMVTDRVPGYPAFLAAVYTIFGENNIAVVAVQAFIDSLTCVVIGLIAETVIARSFLVSGFISVINLNMIVLSGMILTDTLFLFLFSLFILFIFNYLKYPTKIQLFTAISFLCLATLVRPVSYYLVFFLLPLLIGLFVWKNITFKQAIYSLVLYIIPVLIAFGSLHYRNYDEYNSFSLTSQGGGHALNWVVPASYQYSGQGSYQEGKTFAKSYIERSMSRDNIDGLSDNPFERSSYRIKAAKDALEDLGLMNMLHAWSVGAAINMLTPSAAYMPVVRAMEHPSFYATPGDGAVEKLINYVTNTNGLFYLSIIAIGTLISIVFIIIFVYGLYKMAYFAWVENRNREILFLSLFIIIYFFAITGPIIGVKYRLPVEPIMTLFFAYAASNLLRNKIHRKSGS